MCVNVMIMNVMIGRQREETGVEINQDKQYCYCGNFYLHTICIKIMM